MDNLSTILLPADEVSRALSHGADGDGESEGTTEMNELIHGEVIQTFLSKQPFVSRNRKSLNVFFIIVVCMYLLSILSGELNNAIFDVLFWIALIAVIIYRYIDKHSFNVSSGAVFIYNRVDAYEDSLLFRRNTNQKFDRTNRVKLSNIIGVTEMSVPTETILNTNVDVFQFETRFNETVLLNRNIDNASEFIDFLTCKKIPITLSQHEQM